LLAQPTGKAVDGQHVLRHKNLSTRAFYVKPARTGPLEDTKLVEETLRKRTEVTSNP